MSKLISEEIVEAITLGDKEGFMSAFHSALAAKVSDALEIKKVEIASTLIAPASSEVVEEEVEQIDEAADYTLKHVGTSHPKDVTDDEDQPVKATEKSYEIHKGGKKVGELEHHYNEYGGHFYSGNLHGRRFPWDRNNNSLGGKNDAHSYLASALKSKWHTSKHSATNEEVELDEAKHSYEPKIHRSGEHEDPDTHPANGKPDAIVDIEDGRKALIFHNYDYKKGVGHGKHTYVRKTDGDDDYVYHNHPKVPAEKVKQDFTNLDEEVEEIDEAKKSETRISWRSRTPEEIEKSDKRLMKKGKLKITSAELEARARARRGEKSE